jgi:hypothetical protein
VLASCALGLITCPVTRLFAFTPKDRVAFAPAIHPDMDLRLYAPHAAALRALGCVVLGGDDLFASWRDAVDHVEQRLAPTRRREAGRIVTLGRWPAAQGRLGWSEE